MVKELCKIPNLEKRFQNKFCFSLQDAAGSFQKWKNFGSSVCCCVFVLKPFFSGTDENLGLWDSEQLLGSSSAPCIRLNQHPRKEMCFPLIREFSLAQLRAVFCSAEAVNLHFSPVVHKIGSQAVLMPFPAKQQEKTYTDEALCRCHKQGSKLPSLI